jgi:hypothetical protein
MYSQYIYSLILHTVNNKHLYTPNSKIHKYGTRYNNDLHLPIANLAKYTEGPYFSAIKITITFRNIWNPYRLTKNVLNIPWRGFCVNILSVPFKNTMILRTTFNVWKNLYTQICLLLLKNTISMQWIRGIYPILLGWSK